MVPWVGDQFDSVAPDYRLLIVGESHYHDGTIGSIKKHNSPTYTIEVVEELAIDRCYYETKIFPNLHRALFRNDEFDSEIFWNLISYYNFVQKPMNTNKGRPSYDDYYSSWSTFLEIIKILKPRTCLFVGTSAANSLEHALQTTKYQTEGVQWEDWISNAYAKSAIIKDEHNRETNLVFIRHASQMFSWSKWNEYLKKKMPDIIDWLNIQLNDKLKL